MNPSANRPLLPSPAVLAVIAVVAIAVLVYELYNAFLDRSA